MSQWALSPANHWSRGSPPIHGIEDGAFLSFLVEQCLAPYWHFQITSDSFAEAFFSSQFIDGLKQARVSSTVAYMAQSQAIRVVDFTLDRLGIAYSVFKGAHLREWVYPEPSLRFAGDIDILVLPQDRLRTIDALQRAGFILSAVAENVSHEATLSKAGVHIDLHWDILRPGRTRVPLSTEFLSRRVQRNGLWTLSDTDAVFLMLVHPAFTKYVCSPLMSLNRALDFVLLVQSQVVDWDGVIHLLERTGTKTAAWAVLNWFVMVSPTHIYDLVRPVIARLEPGGFRKRYLNY